VTTRSGEQTLFSSSTNSIHLTLALPGRVRALGSAPELDLVDPP
jgi:hypothetical protein